MRISDWSSDVCSSDLHHVGRIFGAAVDFGLPLLPAEALDLGHGHAGDAEPGQRLAHLVELERFDDSQDQLHDAPFCLWPDVAVQQACQMDWGRKEDRKSTRLNSSH